jgi:HKD family nuclease/diadenosine tetraphosphate (Ap4A) HIT family hydrolase
MRADCPFCAPDSARTFHVDDLFVGLWDKFPVSEGHALLVPRRHVHTWFDVTPLEQAALLKGVGIARAIIETKRSPDGYNIGINVGDAAGQTVPHLHVHLIPRYAGDSDDPRGGVRHVIPRRGNYLAYPLAADASALTASDSAIPATSIASPKPSAKDSASEARLLSTGEGKPLLPLLEADLASADQADIAVAFVQQSGIALLYAHLDDLLRRGATFRFLTGDYLDITDPDALQRLLDLKDLHPEAPISLRVFESSGKVFHAKAYVITNRDKSHVAYVGSSNLTGSALQDSIEWNYKIASTRDPEGHQQVRAAFESLFAHASTRPLDFEWVRSYRKRRSPPVIVGSSTPPDIASAHETLLPPLPNSIQRHALEALEKTRLQGYGAGLVVLATGVGKTWLSAFDTDRSEFQRILFVAHREEILGQALRTYRRIRPTARLGFYHGGEKRTGADILFASIQTLGKRAHLDQFARKAFDYIVIDEFHHASAATYRRLIEHFEPKFLLGLTATPERTDGGDLLGLCEENLVYRCDVSAAIREGLLCCFSYFGVPDDVDYTNIPWRSGRFDEDRLTDEVSTHRRAANTLEQWQKHGGSRTLAFCVSQRHADFMCDWFKTRGVAAAAVHSGSTSHPRALSLEQLESGALEIVFAVDMFNEGVDMPSIDTVMMLRPTESQILCGRNSSVGDCASKATRGCAY